MGCDIHTRAEKRDAAGNWTIIMGLRPFDWPDYGMYCFLAGVQNYSAVPPIAEARRLPYDIVVAENDWFDYHSLSWLLVKELLAFDYDATFEDRRVTHRVGPNAWDGSCTAEPGGGEKTTYRKFLGNKFFADLEKLKAAGAERVVFGFDS